MQIDALLVYIWSGLLIFFILYSVRRFFIKGETQKQIAPISIFRSTKREDKPPVLQESETKSIPENFEIEDKILNTEGLKEKYPEEKETKKSITSPSLSKARDWRIEHIEGVGPKYAERLKAIGITRTSQLLKAGSTSDGIKRINEGTGIYSNLIRKWVRRSGLLSIQGIDNEYSRLLEESGINSIMELAHSDPKELYRLLLKNNDEKKLVSRSPSEAMISRWIRVANELYKQ
jgi:predicted flap endonuclease-1-like 5' DNA nuclease